jgi:hypothetical protein
VVELRSLVADPGQRKLRLILSEPQGGSRAAYGDISAGELPILSIFRQVNDLWGFPADDEVTIQYALRG